MEEIRNHTAIRLPSLPKVKMTPLLTDAIAFAALGGGGYAALRLMGLLFRAFGVD